jgi:ABC-type amino acid transport system permease subunit
MVTGADLLTATAATIVLWAVSGSLAIIIALALTAGSLSNQRILYPFARAVVHLTRGVPTSLFVIFGGLATMRLGSGGNLPVVFPGTPAAFQLLAWSIAAALAFGSAGHLAEIFRASCLALGEARLQEARILGCAPFQHFILLARECAAVALPATGTRLVHHLHNTAFAALFPVGDLFGAVQSNASVSFQVFHYAVLGCVIYVGLSGLIWFLFRALESTFAPLRNRPERRRVLAWS